MAGTKVEIQLIKEEPGSWAALNVPPKQAKKKEEHVNPEPEPEVAKVDALDLDDLELGSGAKFVLSPEASQKL